MRILTGHPERNPGTRHTSSSVRVLIHTRIDLNLRLALALVTTVYITMWLGRTLAMSGCEGDEVISVGYLVERSGISGRPELIEIQAGAQAGKRKLLVLRVGSLYGH